MKRLLIFILSLAYLFNYSQELKVSADKNPAVVGEQVLIQYVFSGNSNKFSPPNFNDLQVISGPNTSTQSSYSFVNGKSESTTTTTYSYYVKPLKKGIYTISSASIKVKGEKISSNTYQLKVVDATKKSIEEQKKLSQNLFIKVNVSKKNIVVGEQILVTYKLYTRIDLHNTEINSLPNLNGFWTKDLETSSRFKREILNGIPYNAVTIKKTVLTAQKSGELFIDPLELKCSIRIQTNRNSRDPFANFFSNSYNIKEEIISSKKIKVNVNELPDPPTNFSGIVGNIEMKSKTDINTVSVNDAVTYTLEVFGTGNIELIEPPKINFPDDFEVYDPKISSKIFEGGRKRSKKIFEYLMIPRYKGEFIIPSTSLIVYDSRSKKYQTINSNNHKISVTKNQNNEAEQQSITSENIIKLEKKDIHYIFTNIDINKTENSYISKNLYIILLCLPFIIFILLWIIFKYKNDEKNGSIKNKKANKIALKRLKSAQKCIKNSDFDAFFEEIEKSLLGYFADKFKVSAIDISKENIYKYFEKSKITSQTQEEFLELLEKCQFVRYAPSNNKYTQVEKILNQATNIIIQVETELK